MTNGKGWKKFSPETVHKLFTAVDEDNRVDKEVSLPLVINLQCTQDSLSDNYALCIQYWEEGFTRRELLNLILSILNGGKWSDKERMRFKYIRARYKHLRFAQRLYSKRHISRFWFSKTTLFLGHFQDAFRNNRRNAVKFYGRILCFYLSTPVWNWVNFSLRHMPFDSVSNFIAYQQREMRRLQVLLAKTELTGHEFHTIRKIVSQLVSYYDTSRIIDPDNPDLRQISRFLAAINGLMGDQHDEMIADNVSGRKSYNERCPLDIQLRQRLELLVERFPLKEEQ